MDTSLKKYIETNGMTVTELAGKTKLPVSTVWRYVNGKFQPNAKNALKVSKATGLSLHAILSITENKQ